MKCPVDGETLVITERSGVEIDYCPKCRGVWLDRGELDKILDRAAPAPARPEPQQYRPERSYDRDSERKSGMPIRRYSDDDDDRYRGGKRREHWLSDIFDF